VGILLDASKIMSYINKFPITLEYGLSKASVYHYLSESKKISFETRRSTT